MKKKAIFLICVLMVITFGVYIFLQSDSYEQEDEITNVDIVTKSYKTEFIIYGDDIEFDERCHVRKIDEITEANLTSDDTYMYTVFIINDLNNSVTLTQQDLDILYNKSYNQKIDFFYLGKDEVKAIKEKGIFSQDLLEAELSLGVIHERNLRIEVVGVWDENDHKIYLEKNHMLLSESLLDLIVSKIRFDNM